MRRIGPDRVWLAVGVRPGFLAAVTPSGRDLSRIKSGFVVTVAAKGEPVTFYLDDIGYE